MNPQNETIRGVLQYELEQLQGDDQESQKARNQINDAIKSLSEPKKEMKADLVGFFALHLRPDGFVDYVGEVIHDSGELIRIEVCDAVMLTGCGLWSLSGELKDLPRNECRLFNDKTACYASMTVINSKIPRMVQ